jgi:hypothetical protein
MRPANQGEEYPLTRAAVHGLGSHGRWGWSRHRDSFRHDGRDGLAAAAAPVDTAAATTARAERAPG